MHLRPFGEGSDVNALGQADPVENLAIAVFDFNPVDPAAVATGVAVAAKVAAGAAVAVGA